MTKSILTLFCAVSIALAANGVYRDSTKNIVTDARTGLMWQDDAAVASASTYIDWTTAISTCENLSLGGYTGWRLPNINELESIRDTNSSSQAINAAFVNATSDGYWSPITNYWSSTTFTADTTRAWYFGGEVSVDPKNHSCYVRCVRGQ